MSKTLGGAVCAGDGRIGKSGEFKLCLWCFNTDVRIDWITYDPFHNRVLFTNNSRSLISFDIATAKSQTLIDLKPVPDSNRFIYDPATGLFFTATSNKMYSHLVKPGSNHEVYGNFVIDAGQWVNSIAVDSCGGYIYWILEDNTIERVRLNGSEREELIGSSATRRFSLTIDPQTRNMYWTNLTSDYYGSTPDFILSADFNGKHRKTLYRGRFRAAIELTVSNDFIYWTKCYKNEEDKFFWKIPKNLPIGTVAEPEQIAFKDSSEETTISIAAKYVIEEQIQGTPLCKALKRLLPDYSETNHSDSLNISTDGSLLRVNETKVSGESRVSGDTWNVPVCQYYCLQGNCSVRADRQPKCRCNAGYSGVRCEVNVCQTYCLHDGVCSLSEQNNPVCQCTGEYQGERCDVPAFLIKCSQTVSMLKDILNADLTSVTEGKAVNSCASPVV